MEFSVVQERFLKSKSLGYQLLKGKENTGKSTLAIYKAINLESNYCIYDEDKVLMITSNKEKKEIALEFYRENKNYFNSLFTTSISKVEIYTIEDFIEYYSSLYKKQNLLNVTYIDENKQLDIINVIINQYKDKFKKIKFLNNNCTNNILNEVSWIKACGISKEEYLVIDRVGRENRIRKNSSTRECVYDLKNYYNSYLQAKGYIDKYDDAVFAMNYFKINKDKYTHIILDDCELLTKVEINFVKNMQNIKDYSFFIFIINSQQCERKDTWLVKGRKVSTLGGDFKGKSFLFKSVLKKKKENTYEFEEKFKYVDLKHKSTVNFSLDSSSTNKDIFVDNNFLIKEEELSLLPVYSSIAAGQPILINDMQEDAFYLPQLWVGKLKDKFILRVKGDSMIGRGISDGDFVVIKKQNTAYNNDIVAVDLDGESTLKTLSLNEKEPLLMPANPAYNPITLKDKNIKILGIAIGVIKLVNNKI